MSERYPRIRIRAESGALLVREGLSFSFYMRGVHKTLRHGVSSALETYVRAVGPEVLHWYYDDEGEPQSLDERRWDQARRELLADDFAILQLGDTSTESRYHFEYWGKAAEMPLMKHNPGAVCAATFWLPTEFLEEQGPGKVRELAMALAAPLPLCSGHGGLAFNAAYHLVGVRREVARYWFRYPGIDVFDSLSFYSWKIGTRVRAPHWLTFLGQPVLGELGGPDGLRSRLHTPGTTVQEMDGDKVLITLGTWPETGDTERGEPMPAYRELAKVLEPWLFYEPDGRMLRQSAEDTRRWERRFLD